MKRTSFLLASLTAIALFACSNDNSISSAEDLNNPQIPPALKKSLSGTPFDELQALPALPAGDEVQGIDPGQSTINSTSKVSCGSMSASITTGYEGWSSEAVCDFRNLPSNARNISYQFTGGGPSGSGLSTDYVYIECGNYYGYFTPLSIANIYTTAFANTPANVVCYIAFHGACYGNVPNYGSCTLTVSNVQGTQTY